MAEVPHFTPLPKQTCHAPTRAGNRCTRKALPDHVFCMQHAHIGRMAFSVSGSMQYGPALLWNNGAQPESIFHYTRTNALESILDNRCLWLSRYDHLNDSAEVSYGADRLRVAATSFGGAHAELLSESIAALTEHLRNIFILSTSIHGDSLSLWNGYSGGDDPVCIEFPPGAFLSALGAAHTSVPVGTDTDSFRPLFFSELFQTRTGRVLYDPAEQEHYARKAIEQCLVYLAEPDPPLLRAAPLFVRDVLLTILLLFKEPSFYHENEYRFCLIGREEEPDLPLLVKNRSCEWSDDGTLPYIELPLHFDRGLVRSVMSGPRFSNWASKSQQLREKIDNTGADSSAVAFLESVISLRF